MNIKERIQILEQNDYTVLSYTKNKSGEIIYYVKCNNCNTEYRKTYSQLLKGCTRCNKKQKIIKNFQQKIDLKFGKNKYQVIEYINSDTKAKIKCLKCNSIIEFKPNDLSRKKYICKKCDNLEKRKQAFLNKFYKKEGCENYKILECDYQGTQAKTIKMKCLIHNEEYYSTPEQILSTKGFSCQKCRYEKTSQSKRKPFKEYLSILQEIHPEYDYSLNDPDELVTKNTSKIKVICPEHGLFEPLLSNHIDLKTKCPQCAIESNANKRRYSYDDIKERFYKQHHLKGYKLDDEYNKSHYKDMNSKIRIICNKGHIFYSTAHHLLIDKNACNICWHNNKTSQGEREVEYFINNELNIYSYKDTGNIITKDKTLSKKSQHIDIVMPDYNIGIEYHGLWSHSSNDLNEIKDRRFRYKDFYKTNISQEKGIQLLIIWENEWKHPIKQKIWKSIIRSKLNKIKNRIYARNCKIKEIDPKTYQDFCNNNHIQGSSRAGIKLGLFYNDELVSIMSFGSTKNITRMSSKHEYELIRFCNKIDTIVVGGASKLFKYFIKKYDPQSIISYANRRWSNGNLYEKLGFKLITITPPNYFYVDKNNNIYPRQMFMKHKLKDKLENYNEDLSEIENVINNGYRIIFDSGNYKFVWKKKEEKEE